MNAVEAVGRPVGARRDHDEIRAVVEHAVDVELLVGDEGDVADTLELDHAVVDQPAPLGEPVELGDPLEVTAEVAVAIDEMDVRHAAPTERERAFHARRPGPEDEHGAVAVARPSCNAPDATPGGTPRRSSGSACR